MSSQNPAAPRVSDETKARFPGAAEHLAELDGFVTDYESRVRFRLTPEDPSNPELSIRDKALSCSAQHPPRVGLRGRSSSL
jgi:hypothetical protein